MNLALTLSSASATTALAAELAQNLSPGDVILLSGDVGAGKTHFARGLIQSVLTIAEDVPSPTFTLVQTYETQRGAIWHADLYRLGSTTEIEELGLADAFLDAICLIEWPDRLDDQRPKGALDLTLKTGETEEERHLSVTWSDAKWDTKLEGLIMKNRAHQAKEFIAQAGWADADRQNIAGDASNRRYDRLRRSTGETVVLMDAPSEKGEDVRPFVAIANHLSDIGLSAPKIFEMDAEHGFLLIEDLGDDLFARVLEREPDLEQPLYNAAVDVLSHLHAKTAPALKPYSAQIMTEMAALAYDFYLLGASGSDETAKATFTELFLPLCTKLDASPKVLIQRDYHAENLLWLPSRTGHARVGLLDFQDAMLGHPAYDLVSVLQDARRDVPAEIESMMKARYIAQNDQDADDFNTAYAILGLQRNLRILGVFARLCMRDGKAHYVDLIPRVWNHIVTNLEHPAVADCAAHIRATLPAPTDEILERLRSKCATLPKP